MPGILPMKVIKVGGTLSQTRIAQACDRCRSKKIRCDGIRPSCTQCVNVGFECKTSDKLSRRAFPRGYTESLEERVRALESEVRELKDLLDEKDEKIDMLSRIHSHSPQSMQTSPRPSAAAVATMTSPANSETSTDRDEFFKVTQSPILLESDGPDGYFVGTSSGRALVDAFKNKVQESGKVSVEIRADTFFKADTKHFANSTDPKPISWRPPPRLMSDQLVNIFFQEWAPIFPVLHRPTFLHLYDDYTIAPEAITNKKLLAQLHLVFGIAALSGQSHHADELSSIERQWRAALDTFMMTDSLVTLQCLTLAIIYCLQAADHSGLLKFKSLAVSLSQRLGLHQSQKRFALNTLTSETRKKVFWTLFTLDCFSSAQLGLPKLIRDEDIHCEYPVDADDEYVTEKGFLPTLPGESTKLSCALALFRATPILAKVLKELYPASPTHEVSFKAITALADELDGWQDNLPSHLRLTFVQDKPSTNVINSRSPLLSLAYQYIRSLIHRPAVCTSSSLGDRASSSVVAVAASAKCTIQIIQLLEERNLCFSFCLNKNELLIVSGFSLLFQSLDLDRDSKLLKDHQRMLKAIVQLLEQRKAQGARTFRKAAAAILSALAQAPSVSQQDSSRSAMTTQDALRSTQKHLKAIAARLSPSKSPHRDEDSVTPTAPDTGRRATMPVVGSHPNNSQHSLSSIRSESGSANARSSPSASTSAGSPSMAPSMFNRPALAMHKPKRSSTAATNLDYLSFSAASPANASPHLTKKAHPQDFLRAAHNNRQHPHHHGRQSLPAAPRKAPQEITMGDWERLVTSLDQPDSNIYDAIYGGPAGVDLSSLSLCQLPSSTSSSSVTMPLSSSSSSGAVGVVVDAQHDLVWDAHSTASASTTSPPSHLDASAFWQLSGVGVNALDRGGYGGGGGGITLAGASPAAGVPQSVMSFSDESLSSSGGDEFSSASMSGSGILGGTVADGSASGPLDVYKEVDFAMLKIPSDGVGDMGGLDAGFGL